MTSIQSGRPNSGRVGFDERPNKVSSMGRAIAASMWGEAQAATFFKIRTRNVHYGLALNAARDALLALRNPTVEMFDAAGRATGMEETALLIWRAMIDAALASEGADDRPASGIETEGHDPAGADAQEPSQ